MYYFGHNQYGFLLSIYNCYVVCVVIFHISSEKIFYGVECEYLEDPLFFQYNVWKVCLVWEFHRGYLATVFTMGFPVLII